MNVLVFFWKCILARQILSVQTTKYDLLLASFQALVKQRVKLWSEDLSLLGVAGGSGGQFVTKFRAISHASGTSPKPPTNLHDLRHRRNPTPHAESHLPLPPNFHAINRSRCRCRRRCRLRPPPHPHPSFLPSPPSARRRSRPQCRRPSC